MERTVGEMSLACGGKIINCLKECKFNIVVINDNDVVENCVFAVIKGEKHDGAEFARSAVEKGACAVLTDRKLDDLPCIVVNDVKEALGRIASFYRKKEIKNLLAITGSYGKTTVKELCASVLCQKHSLLKTNGNKNNLLGLPLTLLSNAGYENAVVELGISEFDEMERLSEIAAPDAVIITAIGLMHSETLGTRENIAQEKLKILSYANKDAILIIPENEPLIVNFSWENKITVAIESDTADYSACNIRFCEDGTIFDVKKSGEPYLFELFVPIIGLHGALDSAFAVALADINGVDGQKIREGLLRYKSIENRQNIIEKNGVILMADCYNFGPESARASLEAFEILEKRKNAAKTVVVFGSMLELGEISESEHISLGKRLAAYKFDALLTLGSEARDIAKGARLAQMNESSIFSFSEDEREQAGKMLENLLCENCAVLLKGSRKMKMEEFIPIILCKR